MFACAFGHLETEWLKLCLGPKTGSIKESESTA